MKTSKKQKIRNRIISVTIFLLFSIVLFINNLSDLFTKYGLSVSISWVTWIGLIGSVIYVITLAAMRKI